MKKLIQIPTGYLFTDNYSKGELETLSIGDYGKRHNVKADFLGYTKEIDGVPNTDCMPLSEKWVITLSTQYGCIMKCNFCDVPNVDFRGNATFHDMKAQLYNAISLFPSVTYTERMNIHFARMGEPIFNDAVFDFAKWLYTEKKSIEHDAGLRIEVVHPVLTTSLPARYKRLEEKIMEWCKIKNDVYNGQAGLQFSINSTDETQRNAMFGGLQLSLDRLSEIADRMPYPISRKYCLNFAYSTNYKIDANKLKTLFDTDKFMVKITPIHNNTACMQNNIKTIGGYESFEPYSEAEKSLIKAGFDVLVFIPSMDEEHGLVTCGNLVLGGSQFKEYDDIIKIEGLNA